MTQRRPLHTGRAGTCEDKIMTCELLPRNAGCSGVWAERSYTQISLWKGELLLWPRDGARVDCGGGEGYAAAAMILKHDRRARAEA